MKVRITSFLLAYFLLINGILFSQDKSGNEKYLHQLKDSLIYFRTKTANSNIGVEKLVYNNKFNKLMEEFVSYEGSFKISLDSVPFLGVLIPPSGDFRLINWNFATDEGTHIFYGFIQMFDKKNKQYQYLKLIDKSDEIKGPETKSLDNTKWYGALYYQMIQVEKRSKTYYVLLGWDGNNPFSTKKIMETMYFQGNRVKFGKSVFKDERATKSRVILEYSSEAIVSLKYHPDKNQIIFDHLIPLNEGLIGARQYYVPDFTFDAFELKKGKWYFKPDVDIRLEKEPPGFNTPN